MAPKAPTVSIKHWKGRATNGQVWTRHLAPAAPAPRPSSPLQFQCICRGAAMFAPLCWSLASLVRVSGGQLAAGSGLYRLLEGEGGGEVYRMGGPGGAPPHLLRCTAVLIHPRGWPYLRFGRYGITQLCSIWLLSKTKVSRRWKSSKGRRLFS